MNADQDRIRELAYHLWQEAGCPEGRDLDFWLAAEARLTVATPPAKAAAKPKAAARAKPKAAGKTRAAAKG